MEALLSIITLFGIPAKLASYPGQAVYVDFWASWCTACQQDNSVARESKEYLQNEAIAYVYISLDRVADERKWTLAAIKDKITDNHYLLADDFSCL